MAGRAVGNRCIEDEINTEAESIGERVWQSIGRVGDRDVVEAERIEQAAHVLKAFARQSPTVVSDSHGPKINEAFDVLLSQSRQRDGIVKVSIRIKDDWVLMRAAAAITLGLGRSTNDENSEQHY